MADTDGSGETDGEAVLWTYYGYEMTRNKLEHIQKLRGDGMTVGDIAAAIKWPKHAKLRKLERLCGAPKRLLERVDERPAPINGIPGRRYFSG